MGDLLRNPWMRAVLGMMVLFAIYLEAIAVYRSTIDAIAARANMERAIAENDMVQAKARAALAPVTLTPDMINRLCAHDEWKNKPVCQNRTP